MATDVDFDWTAAIGQVLTTVVIAKVTIEIAEKLGLDDSIAGVLGAVAGIYGGHVVGGMIRTSRHESPSAGESKSSLAPEDFASAGPTTEQPTQTQQPQQRAVPEPSSQAQGIMANATGSNYNAAGRNPGMQPAIQPSQVQQQQQGVPGMQPAVDNSNTTKIPSVKPEEDQSWWDKIISSDRTMDTIVGGVAGAAQGYIAGKTVEDARKAEYARDDAENQRLEGGWANQNLNNVSQIGYPNQTPGPYKPPGMMANSRVQ